MSNKKISELTAAAALAGTELVPIVQSSATVRTTVSGILTAGLPGTFSTLTATAGSLNGIVIGGTVAAAGTFTTINATGGGSLTGTWSNLGTVTTIDINGGTLDGVVIGGAAAAAATVTTLTVNTNANPDADDGAGLGTTALGWSDLFGASGFTWNIANGNWLATHTSGILTVTTGDLRVTTAGTNAASVVTVGGTQTLTNKTLTTPALTLAQSAGPTPTAEGVIEWDTDDNVLRVGDGSATKQIGIAQTATSTATGGTSLDFTGIPSGAKRITINIAGLSWSAGSTEFLQIGDSGGVETSGYSGSASVLAAGVSSSNHGNGFVMGGGAAANVYHGALTLTLLDAASNLWAVAGTIGLSSSAATVTVAGTKALSATLDRVRLTTTGGVATVDANTGVSVQIE